MAGANHYRPNGSRLREDAMAAQTTNAQLTAIRVLLTQMRDQLEAIAGALVPQSQARRQRAKRTSRR